MADLLFRQRPPRAPHLLWIEPVFKLITDRLIVHFSAG